ncbi:hypothetical protein N2152v2_006745 [Parachlorella kessleri]
MAAAADKFVCCSGVSLPAEERDGLLCVFEEKSVQGELVDGIVRCSPPADALLQAPVDVEQPGLRLRVTAKTGRTLHDGVVQTSRSNSAALAESFAPDGDPAGPPGAEPVKARQTVRQKYSALKPFVIISMSYLLYTVTDGAIRMIVLLHAYQMGFSAMEVAIMFSLYELAGVVTNLLAGLMGARWGIKTTLLTGLVIQLAGLGMMFGWQDSWSKTNAIIYVTASQMLCGVAKDLTKLGGKTVTKLVTPEEKQSSLFKLVSFITGFKNSLKGAGYFLGAATVGVSYYLSLGILCGFILAAMPWAALGLSNQLGRARKENVSFWALFKNRHNVNVLSLSRIFLFGSRDLWFEVPLPFFLRSAASGIGWSRALTGAFLAIFIILYGQVQAWTPQLVLKPLHQSPPTRLVATGWAAILSIPPLVLGTIMLSTGIFGIDVSKAPAIATLTVGIYIFCLLFAVNSAVHSYLIVRYSEGDKVAMNVGVYYCANAVGRLVGTLASGALYSYVGSTVVDGFGACLLVSVSFCVLSTLIDIRLWEDPDKEGAWVPQWLRARKAALPPKEAAAAEALEQAAEAQPGAPADSSLELAEKTRSSTEKEGYAEGAGGQGGRLGDNAVT